MRVLALFILLAISMGLRPRPSGTIVHICTGPNAEVYHYDNGCRGLNSCKHEIKAISKEKAIELGRRLCGWED